MPDILEKVQAYERDRKMALLRSKGFNNNDRGDGDQPNTAGAESASDEGPDSGNFNASQLGDKSTDFVRTEVPQQPSTTTNSKSMKPATTTSTNTTVDNVGSSSSSNQSKKKDSTSLLDMFQLNEQDENEKDPIWQHFQKTKSQSVNKSQNLNKSLLNMKQSAFPVSFENNLSLHSVIKPNEPETKADLSPTTTRKQQAYVPGEPKGTSTRINSPSLLLASKRTVSPSPKESEEHCPTSNLQDEARGGREGRSW